MNSLNYSVLVKGSRGTILRTAPDGTSSPVTTVNDPVAAKELAAALTRTLFQLATSSLVAVALAASGNEHLAERPADYLRDDPRHLWHQLPASTSPVDLRRRALNAYDAGINSGARDDHFGPWFDLGALASASGEGVRRAVRDEVARMMANYTGTPVLARLWDRKYDTFDTVFLANDALGLLSPDRLTALVGSPDAAHDLLSALEEAGLADWSPYADASDESYMMASVNAEQLNAWCTARAATLP